MPDFLHQKKGRETFKHRFSLFVSVLFNLRRQIRVIFGLARFSLLPLALRQPHILVKYMKRNYLALNLSSDTRVALLLDHYRFVDEVFDRPTVRALLAPGIKLWEHQGDVYNHQIALQFSEDPYHEGELTLCYRVSGEVVYWLGFTVVNGSRLNLSSDRVAFVTRVQSWATYDLVKKAAKDVDDIFPVYAMFAALEGIAEGFDLDGLLGVDAASQASSRDRKYSAERAYDDLFMSLGGTRASEVPSILPAPGDGPVGRFFWMPLGREETVSLETKPKHRARAKKRRKFRADVREAAASSVLCKISSRFKRLEPRPLVEAFQFKSVVSADPEVDHASI